MQRGRYGGKEKEKRKIPRYSGDKRRREKRGYIEKRQWRATEQRNKEDRSRSTEGRDSGKETKEKKKRGEIEGDKSDVRDIERIER